MLGIIGAMDVEIELITSKIINPVITKKCSCEFTTGLIENVMVTIARCSPGKVNAALCTQAMIDTFNPDFIINTGVGCSLQNRVAVKNIVIATDVCQYDMDITALGEPKGFINGLNTVKISANKKISEELARAAIKTGEKIHRGTIASGDTFIASRELKAAVAQEFDAVCGEMEGGAVGHVCAANKVPFAVIRAISDGGNEAAKIDYPSFKKIAAEKSAAIIVNFIKTEQTQTSLF